MSVTRSLLSNTYSEDRWESPTAGGPAQDRHAVRCQSSGAPCSGGGGPHLPVNEQCPGRARPTWAPESTVPWSATVWGLRLGIETSKQRNGEKLLGSRGSRGRKRTTHGDASRYQRRLVTVVIKAKNAHPKRYDKAPGASNRDSSVRTASSQRILMISVSHKRRRATPMWYRRGPTRSLSSLVIRPSMEERQGSSVRRT